MHDTSGRIPIMEGALSEFSLADILQVVSLGRQFTGIELRREDNSPAGVILVKGGKVVEVETSGIRGKEAFMRLFGLNTTFFHVFRTEAAPESLPEPIGSIGSLLAETWGLLETTTPHGRIPDKAPVEKKPAHSAHSVARQGAGPAVQGRSPYRGEPRSDHRPAARSSVPAARTESPRPSSSSPFVAAKSRTAIEKRIIAVASPKGGAGKTTLALNLSVSLARQGRSVILVDASPTGDILGAIDSFERVEAGVFDVLAGKASLEKALMPTAFRELRLLPSTGAAPLDPIAAGTGGSSVGPWQALLGALATQASLVIVDTPPGMHGITQQILAGCTHVIGVLQCETFAQRTFPVFFKALESLPEPQRPQLLGVFLNMLQAAHPSSVAAFRDACTEFPSLPLFDTAIPRNPAFLTAAEAGVPLRLMDEAAPPAVTWLFDAMAAEVTERLGMAPAEVRPQKLLA